MDQKPKVEEVFSALGDSETLRLFRLASVGIEARTEAITRIGMSRKQFYSRLQKLAKLGLIRKKKGIYAHTTLGTMVQNIQLKPLEELVDSYWKLEAIEMLKAANKIPNEERTKLIETITRGTEFNFLSYGSMNKIKVLNTYDDLVDELLKYVDLAEKEIFIAVRYHEPIVAKKIVDKFKQEIDLYILDGNPPNLNLESIMRAIIKSPPDKETLDFCTKFLNSPNVRWRNKSVPFSFAVVDGVYAGFEVTNPLAPNEFMFAVEVKDEKISQKMKDYFMELWKTAEEPRIKQVATTKLSEMNE
jgi:predicted transcriptional regulator